MGMREPGGQSQAGEAPGPAEEGLEFTHFRPTAQHNRSVFTAIHDLSLTHSADVKTSPRCTDRTFSPQLQNKSDYYQFLASTYDCEQQPTKEFYTSGKHTASGSPSSGS